MLRANLTQIHLVNVTYQSTVQFFQTLNHSLVNFTEKELVFEKDGKKITYQLNYKEEDAFTKTFLSQFKDGIKFRVIKPIGAAKEMSMLKNRAKDGFSIGSIDPQGFSVTFILTDQNDIRNVQIQEKGIDEQLQNLITASLMTLQHNLHNDFIKISKRLIATVSAHNKNVRQFEDGSLIIEVLNDAIELYDENEQRIIRRM